MASDSEEKYSRTPDLGSSKPQSSEERTHNDEEKGPSSHVIDEPKVDRIDPAIEKRVVRKLDLRVMTLVCGLYLLSFLDRTNIGNAKIAGMEEDLQLDGNEYTWLLTIFYIAYIVFQFQGIMWKVMPPHMWAAITVFAWGSAATCQAGVQTWAGEMALRFFLGAAEAGFAPGVPYLLSFFYRRRELGLRCGLFLAAAPVANTFSGALAYAITSGKSKLAPWRLLFFVEGLPTLLMVPVVYYLLPDSPSTARFLNEEEKKVARARAIRQVGRVERIGGLDWKDAFATFGDVKLWIGTLMYFSCLVSFASLPVFLPTVIKEMGFTAVDAQGLTAPPFFLSALVTIGTTWLADRFQQRGWVVIVSSVIAASGYVVLGVCKGVAARYAGVWVAASGLFSTSANCIPWLLNNQGSDTRRGTISVLLNLAGQCGTLLGINVFPDSDRPRYVKGQIICAAFMLLNCILGIIMRTILVHQNRKLDERYGKIAERRGQDNQENSGQTISEEDYGPNFRFVL